MNNRFIILLTVSCLAFAGAHRAFASFDFVATTTEADTAFGFRVYGASSFQVSWDGGSTWEDAVTGDQLLTNVYADAGTQAICVTGTAARITFYGTGCTPTLLTDITSKLSDGVAGINSAYQMFRGCTNITAFSQSDWFDDTVGNVTTLASMFHDALNFNCPGIENWDTSNVTTLRAMFQGTLLFNRNINTKTVNEGDPDEYVAWNISKVTNLGEYTSGYYGTFYNAKAFNQPLDAWDTSNVTKMWTTFYGASSFNQPIGDWNTSNVNDMRALFSNATAFDQDIGAWDTSKVTSMSDMFYVASAFNNGASTNINNWDTANITSMIRMFANAEAFNQPIGNWNTSKVTTMQGLFHGATIFDQDISTKTVNAGGPDEYTAWDVSTVTNFGIYANNRYGTFTDAAAFNQDISNWNTASAARMNRMFYGAKSFNQDISLWNVSKVTDYANFLSGDTNFSQANYDKLLLGWSQQTLQNSIAFNGGTSQYSLEGAGGRVTIAKNHNWAFTDGGLEALAEYEVTNPMELQGCAMHPDEAYVVTNDIDLSETTNWNGGAGFWPIMWTNNAPFSGTFDGGGHLLSGLHINRPGTDYAGLFGKISGTVSNLGVIGSVSGNDYVGGFAGALTNGAVIEDCFARVSVTAASDSAHRGGFCGRNEQGAIRRVYASGTILPSAGSNGGGLAGSKNEAGGYEDTANFWDTDVTGWDTSAMGTGKTKRLMKSIGPFNDAGWKIESTFDEVNDGYPYPTGDADPAWRIYAAPQGTIFSFY